MDKSLKLAEFFEKHYFHEVDARDKLYSRLQIPLAMLLALGGALSFMIQNVDRGATGAYAFVFWGACVVAVIFIGLSLKSLVAAAWGHEYAFLPVSEEWEKYRKECEELYAEYENSDELVDSALRTAIHNKHITCATVNAQINEKRSFSLYLTIRYLIIAACAGFFAFAVFFVANLDKSSRPKPTDVRILNLVEMKGEQMATNKPAAPPQPPPPPPTRLVKDYQPPPKQPVQPTKNGN